MRRKKKELNPKQGKRLSECLDDAKMSQKILAGLSGYTPQYISGICCKKRNMSDEAAESFAKILNVRKEYLLCKDDYKNFDAIKNYVVGKIGCLDSAVLNIMEDNGIKILSVVIVDENNNIAFINDNPSLFQSENDILKTVLSNKNILSADKYNIFVSLKIHNETLAIPYNIIHTLYADLLDYAEFKCQKFINENFIK